MICVISCCPDGQQASYTRRMPVNRPVAQLLRDLRQQQGASLREAAHELGVAASHLSRLERGYKSPSGALRDRAANYYGIAPDVVSLADGVVPEDIKTILMRHPELLSELRERYGDQAENEQHAESTEAEAET
jgi:transcriptional regulator with XRE-family HTH domain